MYTIHMANLALLQASQFIQVPCHQTVQSRFSYLPTFKFVLAHKFRNALQRPIIPLKSPIQSHKRKSSRLNFSLTSSIPLVSFFCTHWQIQTGRVRLFKSTVMMVTQYTQAHPRTHTRPLSITLTPHWAHEDLEVWELKVSNSVTFATHSPLKRSEKVRGNCI